MYRSARFALACCLCSFTLAAGCDAEGLASLTDSDQAQRGMEALMGALGSSGAAELQRGDSPSFRRGDVPDVPDVPGMPDAPELEDVEIDHETEVDAQGFCPNGGAMDITGRIVIDTQIELDDPQNAGGGANTEFSFTVAFSDCNVDGVVIDGELTWEQLLDVESQGGVVDIDYSWSYRGRVEFSGEIEGACEVDMSASGTEDDLEDLGGREYEGSMCGFAAQEVAQDADI